MPINLSDGECKSIIRIIAKKYRVSAADIATKLLAPEDKDDMRNGDLPLESFDLHVKLWKESRCPDYVNTKRMKCAESTK